ncbi:MAG: amidohydrolase family protein, partial [Gammaproteobacteria bacterium]|nr:amidohydrolase family protein [Gammaproteobacteria bacterium]
MTSLRRSIAVVFLLASAMPGFADTTLIHAGQLLAVPGKSPSSRQTIVIENDRIVAVRSGFASADEFDGEVTV